MTSAPPSIVRWEFDDEVMTVTLDGPKTLNAITSSMKHQLLDAIDDAETREDARAIVLRGANGTFCSGADVNELSDVALASPRALLERIEKTQHVVDRIQRSPLPVISVVEGVAAGGGIGLVLAADLVVCAAEARFVLAFAARGLVPDAGLTAMLVDAVGYRRARSLCLRASELTAHEALSAGLADLVVPVTQIDTTLGEQLDRLKELPAVALALTKKAFDSGQSSRTVEALAQALAMKSGTTIPRTGAGSKEEMA